MKWQGKCVRFFGGKALGGYTKLYTSRLQTSGMRPRKMPRVLLNCDSCISNLQLKNCLPAHWTHSTFHHHSLRKLLHQACMGKHRLFHISPEFYPTRNDSIFCRPMLMSLRGSGSQTKFFISPNCYFNNKKPMILFLLLFL